MKRFHVLMICSALTAICLILGGYLVIVQGAGPSPSTAMIASPDQGPYQLDEAQSVAGSVDEAATGQVVEPETTPVPVVDLNQIKPNELGEVPIIEYHLIIDENDRWSRSTASLRQDLERLYQLGYRSISLGDYLDNKITVPAGFSPVVITFDDSSPGQFTFIPDGDNLKPDPNCAVGILEDFAQQHPDFGLHAIFYVLPAADPPHNLFGQDQYQQQKLQYLVQHGFELGNHTYWHQQLTDQPDSEVLHQIGQANKVISDMVPGYQVRTFALPLGEWPPNQALAISGDWEGTQYGFDAVLMAGAAPAPAPNSTDYDPYDIPRVQVLDETMEYWFPTDGQSAYNRYISDGNPDTITFPASEASSLNQATVGDKQVVQY